MPPPDPNYITRGEWSATERRLDQVVEHIRVLRRKDVQHDEMIASNRAMLTELQSIRDRLERPKTPRWSPEDWAKFAMACLTLFAGLYAHAQITKPELPLPPEVEVSVAPQDPIQPEHP